MNGVLFLDHLTAEQRDEILEKVAMNASPDT